MTGRAERATAGRLECVGAAVAAGVALGAAVMATVGFVHDLPGMGGRLLMLGVVLLVGGLVVAALVAVRGRSRGRVVRVESHGHGLASTRLHEAGHVVMARRLGGRVRSVTIRPDGTGTTETVFSSVGVDLAPVDEAALYFAGGLACGDWEGCTSDLRHARQAIRDGYRWSERGRATRQAWAQARSAVAPTWWGGPRGSVRAVARRLPAPGTVRGSRL